MRTIFTAFVSAVIGGLVTALFIFAGMLGLGGDSGDVTFEEASPGGSSEEVTIREVPAARGSSGAASGGGGSSVREVYAQDAPGVVSVDVAATSGMGPGGGSGFVISEAGHIVTNQHVVAEAEEISVRFAGGVRAEAEVVGEDPSTDLAVIRVDAPERLLKPLTLGDSDALGVGDPVITIGNPLNLGISVSTGVVSALGRPIQAPNRYTISNAVQTDAAINPGNSGGPLLDSRGAVIGVNAQIASESGGFEGVGFAIPVNTVKDVVEQIIDDGEVVHGYIGVRMSPFSTDELAAYAGLSDEELRDEYGFPGNGAIVAEVASGGPADDAGIEGSEDEESVEGISQPVPIGDVITEVEGDPVSSSDDVIEVVNSLKPGDKLTLTVVTPNEGERRVEVEVGTRPEGA